MDTHAESHGATHSPRGASLGQGDSVWCLQEQKEHRPQPADGERAKMGQGSLKTKELISHIRMKDSGFLPTMSALLTYNYRKKKIHSHLHRPERSCYRKGTQPHCSQSTGQTHIKTGSPLVLIRLKWLNEFLKVTLLGG